MYVCMYGSNCVYCVLQKTELKSTVALFFPLQGVLRINQKSYEDAYVDDPVHSSSLLLHSRFIVRCVLCGL